jgi:hypothetical protein
VDYLFETPYVAALSTTELDAWAPFDPVPVVRTSNALFTSGIGPFRWTGTMANAADFLFASAQLGPWFVSQLHDVRPFPPLPFDLLQAGSVVESGFLSDMTSPFQLPVTPGRYTLHVPFTQWFLDGVQGRADVSAAFDTLSSDANPPALEALRIEHASAFVDLVPPGGGTVSFLGSDDSGVIADARIHYKTAAGFEAAPVTGDTSTGFTATVPAPGGSTPTGPLSVVLRDGSGNALTYSYCSAATATPEICNGFDDDCDGAMLPGEADQDDDSWHACGGDCDDTNGSIWEAPGEVANLRFDAAVFLSWSPPGTGGQPAAVRYDLLRSPDPRDFVAAATCVVWQSGPVGAVDLDAPSPGAVFFYQVRASNACPDGHGSLGAGSDGVPRAGRSCP